jgi:flagellum-specific peptidoglycan hydrolase FlgJ
MRDIIDSKNNPGKSLEEKYLNSKLDTIKEKVLPQLSLTDSESFEEIPAKSFQSFHAEVEAKSSPKKEKQQKSGFRFFSIFETVFYYFRNFYINIQYYFKHSVLAKTIASIAIIAGLFGVMFAFGSSTSSQNNAKKEVKGANEISQSTDSPEKTEISSAKPTDGFEDWSETIFSKKVNPLDDEDNDQLSNNEEFIIGTNPQNPHTCNPERTDSQNLIELIDPVSCKPIDTNNDEEMTKFRRVIDFQTIKTRTVSNDVRTVKPSSETQAKTITGIFGSASLEELNKQEFNSEKLKTDLEVIKRKEEVIKKIDKVNQYMKLYRSLEPYDRNYPIPVNGAVYIEVSQQYNVPLKYTIAVAQRESRFGTDRYTKEGNLTRPGKYKNVFSMGLDDEGNNWEMATWERGVEEFGKWYKKFNDRGVSDCAKWRIYNPNGDYCQRIEETATQVEAFLNK